MGDAVRYISNISITISMTNLLVINPLDPGVAFLHLPKTSGKKLV